MTNVRQLPPKKPPTVEDAKRVQRLEEHLKALRKHRDFLADKRTTAHSIVLSIALSEAEVPAEAKRSQNGDSYINSRQYRREQNGWRTLTVIKHGTLDLTKPYNNNQGCLPTVGTRVMDGIRAAVFDEIEATERAILELGFAVSSEERNS
jgi:hypothetical protein